MIWNNNVLFIHAPKTAGMSMTNLLLSSLDGDVNITGPNEKKYRKGNVIHWPGRRHESLYDAESVLTYMNRSIFSFEKIFVVMRNPYDLELSRYSYLKQGHDWDKGRAQDLAMNSSYKEYLREAPFFGMNPPRLDVYYAINGCIPKNLVVLKFENLKSDINFYMKEYLKGDIRLERVNHSKHPDYVSVYDKESEELCYRRNHWFFEKGFYSRMHLK
jgi:hypothetical protein